jgi:hypothetical protein
LAPRLRMMKNPIIAIVILIVIFASFTCAQSSDYQSVSDHFNQYSADNINSINRQNETQYSPKNINNPYSQYNVQYSPRNINNLPVQQGHDYRIGSITPGQAAAKKASLPKAVKTTGLLDNAKSKNNAPVFSYLLILSSLALGFTLFVIIGIFKK